MVKPPFDPSDLKSLARALEMIEEVSKKAAESLRSASDYCEEGEEHYDTGDEFRKDAKELMDEIERRELMLEENRRSIERDIIRAEGMLAKIDLANKPVIQLLNDVLMALELDESPATIAAELRRQHAYLDAKW
ncbi:hypothetical protein hairong_074 [Pseudomonas phage hairong]|nr:hypothetical protein hairong_074 [Pseudomonas phage hairong]